jgi:hypothetical protein
MTNSDDRRSELRGRNYLKPSEAAVLIRRDKSTITRWIQNGLAVIHVGRHRFVETKELLRWAADDERRTRRRTSASQ